MLDPSHILEVQPVELVDDVTYKVKLKAIVEISKETSIKENIFSKSEVERSFTWKRHES
jgi:hypothetical protein